MLATTALTPISPPPTTAQPEWLNGLLDEIYAGSDRVPPSLWEAALAGPLREFLSRPGKRFRGQLTRLAWALADRRDQPPPALEAVVELLHAGSLIVDDIEDDSIQRRGRAALHRLVGLPVALNAGNWLYFRALSLLQTLGLPPAAELELHRRANAAVLQCHEGQALDLTAQVGELHPRDLGVVVRAISEWKTGSLMGLAAALGAVAAAAPARLVDAVCDYGVRLGVALQMQNDLSELTGAAGPLKHPEDLLHGRVTWPWAWAAQRLPGAAFDALQARGARLTQGTGDAAALARDLLAALGDDPQRPVRQWLAEAMADLRAVVGDHPALVAFNQEIERLVHRYA
jgi:geranylgeranyl pyrophosphate synthase